MSKTADTLEELSHFKDVFISYGRRESKAFAARLHDRLVEQGYTVWFDQNDIPLGVDFQNQIDEGIEKAHNFIFVIAPHAVKSPYCLKEIELAVKHNKRIIPIIQVEPTDCWDKMHPVIAKLNWIYMREEFVEGVALEDLKPLDDHEAGFEGLFSLLKLHPEYIRQHTHYLNLALDWERRQENPEFLVSDSERQAAEEWLIYEFKDTQPPCLPTELHANFLCESKKYAELGMTDLFISYSTVDAEIRKKVIKSLSKHLITTWMDKKDIKKGEDFARSIDRGIEQADNLLFFISFESIESEWCLKELDYAVSLNKRVIPLLIEEVPPAQFPEKIRNLQYIDFTDNVEEADFDRDVADILNEVNRDRNYYHEHKLLLVQATKWKAQGNNEAYLLRGHHLQQANSWLTTGKKRSKHQPVALHEEFIQASLANAGSLETEICVVYSPQDNDFGTHLLEELALNGKTTWMDQQYIPKDADFDEEVHKGIDHANNVLFIMSPESIALPACLAALEYTQKIGKRIIPLIYSKVVPEAVPEALKDLTPVDFASSDFNTASSVLIRTLDIDREHVSSHSKWQNRALEWERKGKTKDLLLRGAEFAIAEAWLAEALENGKNPKPTPLQKEFLDSSNKAILALKEKEVRTAETLRRRLRNSRIALGVAVLFLIAAITGIVIAVQKTRETAEALEEVEKQRELAVENEKVAKRNEEIASIAKKDAEENAEEALAQKKIAEAALEDVKRKQNQLNVAYVEVEAQRDSAKVKEQEAREAQKVAYKASVEASEERQKALEEKSKADSLFLLSEAQVLALDATGLLNQGQVETAKVLGLHAYFINKEKEGPSQIRNIYDVLFDVLDRQQTEKTKVQLHTESLRSIAHLPGTNLYATADEGGHLKVWQVLADNKTKTQSEVKVDRRIRLVSFIPNTEYLAIASLDGSLAIFRQGSASAKTELPAFDKAILALDIVAFNGKNYMLAASKNTIRLYALEGSDATLVFEHEDNDISAARLYNYRNNLQLVFGQGDGSYALVRPLLQKTPHFSGKANSSVTSLALGHGYLAVGQSSGIVQLRSASEGQFVRNLSGHRSRVSALDFHPRLPQLATASFDKKIKLWYLDESKKGEEDLDLKRHQNWVWDLRYSEDGDLLMSADEDGKIHFWPTRVDLLAEKLCPTVKTKLTKEEMRGYSGAIIDYAQPNCVSYEK